MKIEFFLFLNTAFLCVTLANHNQIQQGYNWGRELPYYQDLSFNRTYGSRYQPGRWHAGNTGATGARRMKDIWPTSLPMCESAPFVEGARFLRLTPGDDASNSNSFEDNYYQHWYYDVQGVRHIRFVHGDRLRYVCRNHRKHIGPQIVECKDGMWTSWPRCVSTGHQASREYHRRTRIPWQMFITTPKTTTPHHINIDYPDGYTRTSIATTTHEHEDDAWIFSHDGLQ